MGLLGFLLDLLYPGTCPGCGLPILGADALCEGCARQIRGSAGPFPRTPTTVRTAGIRRLHAVGAYTGLLGSLVRRVKFGHDLAPLSSLAALLAQVARPAATEPGLVLPVPRSPGSELPFHLASLLAEGVAARWGLEVASGSGA